MKRTQKVDIMKCPSCPHWEKYCNGDVYEPCAWYLVPITTKKREDFENEERVTKGFVGLLQKA